MSGPFAILVAGALLAVMGRWIFDERLMVLGAAIAAGGATWAICKAIFS